MPPAARLLFIGLIVNADDEGLGRAEPAFLRTKILPQTRSRVSLVRQWLSELEAADMISLEQRDSSVSVYRITNFHKYQKLKYRRESSYLYREDKERKEKKREDKVQGQYVAETSTPATAESYPLIDDIAMTFAIGYAKAGKIVETFGTNQEMWEQWKAYKEEKGIRLAVMNIQRYPTPGDIPGSNEEPLKPFAQQQEEKAKADARRLREKE